MPSVEPRREKDEERSAVSESEERLRLAMDAAGMGAWDWDLKTGRVAWSGNQEKLFGVAAGSFSGDFDTFLKLIHPDDILGVQARTAGALGNRAAHHRDEFRIVRPDGTIRWMLANGHIFYDEQGVPVRMIGVNMDVTERKQAEQALRQSERMAATGRLAATIAHELNNPLASVTNILFLLENQLSAYEESRTLVRVAEQEVARMTRIVHQTLAFHRQSQVPVPVSLTELLDSVLALLEPKLRSQGIRVVRRFEGETPVSGFPAELRQVFSNLLINAAEAAGEKSVIIIHVYPSHRWSPNTWGTRVVIADNGPGIPSDIRKHIFEPFFTTKGDKGSGVGLWVSQGIVEKHKGAMRLFSHAGPRTTGTVFSVFLPQVGPQVEAPHERRKRVRTERYPVQMGLDLPASG